MSKQDEKPDDKPITNEPNQDAIDAESARQLREQLATRQEVPIEEESAGKP